MPDGEYNLNEEPYSFGLSSSNEIYIYNDVDFVKNDNRYEKHFDIYSNMTLYLKVGNYIVEIKSQHQDQQ